MLQVIFDSRSEFYMYVWVVLTQYSTFSCLQRTFWIWMDQCSELWLLNMFVHFKVQRAQHQVMPCLNKYYDFTTSDARLQIRPDACYANAVAGMHKYLKLLNSLWMGELPLRSYITINQQSKS